MVRFVAYFLSGLDENTDEERGLRFLSRVEFNVRTADETEPADAADQDVARAKERAA
jgi:hypothetical protein